MMYKLHVISYVTLLGSSIFQGEQLIKIWDKIVHITR